MTARLHLTMLRAASRLVPRADRAEWLDEWRSELWYVEQAGASGTSFCRGASRDAWFLRCHHLHPAARRVLRLETPVQCLAFLAALAVVCLFLSRSLWMRSPYRDPRGLAMVAAGTASPTLAPSISIEAFRNLTGHGDRWFRELAYYRPERLDIRDGGKPIRVAGAVASENLFRLLGVSVSAAGAGPMLVVSADTSRRLAGHSIEVNGRNTPIAMLPKGAWQLPGAIDAWLLDSSAIPAYARVFVVGRVRSSIQRERWKFSLAREEGVPGHFECKAVDSAPQLIGVLAMLLISCMVLPATTTIRLYDAPRLSTHPPAIRMRRWLFLAAKLALALAIMIPGSVTLSMTRVASVLEQLPLFCCVLTLRWVIVDQQRRCPVCLCLLAHPVRIGRPSQTFLEWYGTELVCSRGHGILHVREAASSSYSAQQWLGMDASWSGLFEARMR